VRVGLCEHQRSAQAQYAREVMGKTQVRLREIQLGGFDAESDDKLERDFIETEDVDIVLSGRQFLILGRKGAGKSALFRQVPRLLNERVEDGRRVLNLTPSDYEWSRLAALEYPGIPQESLLRASWKISLLLAVADDALAGDWSFFRLRARRAEKLRSLIVRALGKRSAGESAFQKAIRFFDSFEEANGSVPGVAELGFKRQRNAPPAVKLLEFQKNLEAAVRDVLRSSPGYLVQIDRLDDVWDGEHETKTWLIGLLKATKDFNDDFRSSGAEGAPSAKVIVYLRSDIYETLNYDEKDKLRSFEKRITWTEESLIALVEKRLPNGATLSSIFEPRPIDRAQFPIGYLFDRTFLRPREVLQFVQQCFDESETAALVVTNQVLRDAETTFSGWKVEDLKLEYKKATPDLPVLVEALRQGKHRYDSLEELEAVVAAKAPEVVAEIGARGCLRRLMDTSVIGVRLNASGRVRYRYQEPGLELPAVANVYVHPGLHKGLVISETRKRRAK
jgi:hypothetical protein